MRKKFNQLAERLRAVPDMSVKGGRQELREVRDELDKFLVDLGDPEIRSQYESSSCTCPGQGPR